MSAEAPAAAAPAPQRNPKAERAAAKQAEALAAAAAKAEALKAFAATFGTAPLIQSTTNQTKVFTDIAAITPDMDGKVITVRARVQTTRGQSKVAFLLLRQTFDTIQAVLSVSSGLPQEMMKFAAGINPESIVDVQAKVTIPAAPISSATKSGVELQVEKLHIVSASLPVLPFQYEDASRPSNGDEPATPATEASAATADPAVKPTVSLELRLNYRWMDMRTRASNALFRLESRMGQYFREFLTEKDFVEIHTPKMIGAASEGGANVFKMDYFGKPAFLAQSPQLYKQMVLQGDLERVFEIAPAFRAENANTHRHMTEFISMDLEMRINEHYYEVLNVAEELFHFIFHNVATKCQNLLEAVQEQHPFVPIEHKIPDEIIKNLGVGIIEEGIESTDPYGARIRNRELRMLRIPFPLAIRLYNSQEGLEKIPEDEDIGTEAERTLGRIVKERYGVDFYIMDRYPSSARPFYTMPDPADPMFSNSYDMFIRGQEIVSGAQRIHDPELLAKNALARGVQPESLKDYIDSFRLGAWPHGGFAIGLERIVFLYLGLSNVRYASLFPRDPRRCTP